MIRKARMIRIFSDVSTFCTRAVRRIPRQLTMVKSATMALARTCAPPSLSSQAPDPITCRALSNRQPAEEVPQIVGKCQCGGRDGRGESSKERDPAGHEAPGRSEGLGKVNVLAAGAGKVHAQFRITESACQRAYRAHTPDQQHQLRRSQLPGEKTGSGEDARADHVRDHQRRGTADPELAKQVVWTHLVNDSRNSARKAAASASTATLAFGCPGVASVRPSSRRILFDRDVHRLRLYHTRPQQRAGSQRIPRIKDAGIDGFAIGFQHLSHHVSQR